jgi:hypothetical protein
MADGVRFSIPQPTEGQGIADQINAVMIFARTDCINVHYEPLFRHREIISAIGVFATPMVSSSGASAYRVYRDTVTGTCKGSRGGWGSAMGMNIVLH